ncbi:MAG: TetR/AcrR family transcriptional regulator [Ketobacteraceae bacterium]|nr:TetR/AcrR family transcriptional regulator [Ketobacteraceae bacterium]
MVEETSIATPRRRNTKERIIDEAEKLASIHGIEHLKLQDVADKIGIKLPSVYAHFSGREDILAAMGSRINRAFTQMFLPKAGEPPLESLRRGAAELTAFLGENPAYFRLMLRDLSVPLGYDPVNRRFTLSHGNSIPMELKEMQERIRRMLEQGQQSGSIKPMEAQDLLSTLIGTLLVKFSWIDLPPANDAEEKTIDVEQVQRYVADLVTRLLS